MTSFQFQGTQVVISYPSVLNTEESYFGGGRGGGGGKIEEFQRCPHFHGLEFHCI